MLTLMRCCFPLPSLERATASFLEVHRPISRCHSTARRVDHTSPSIYSYPAPFEPKFHTTQVDIDSVSVSPERPFTGDHCICPEASKEAELHCKACDVVAALAELNPIHRGKQNKRFLETAVTTHLSVKPIIGWFRASHEWEAGGCHGFRVVSPAVPKANATASTTI